MLLFPKHTNVVNQSNPQSFFKEKGGLYMEKTWIRLCLVAVLTVPAGIAMASGGTGYDRPAETVSYSPPGIGQSAQPALFSLCPVIADAEQVRSWGIGYIRTKEFAEAVNDVANGKSSFGPRNTPEEWKGAANLWKSSVASSGKPKIVVMPGDAAPGKRQVVLLSPGGTAVDPARIGLEERSCNSELLFRASLEYRSRRGQENTPLLYPHLVRDAAAGIGKIVTAKMELAGRSAARLEETAKRIQQAERMGAGECQPRELARAKAELAIANRGITELDFDPSMTETVLARAESLSGNLLTERRYAASRGIRCLPE